MSNLAGVAVKIDSGTGLDESTIEGVAVVVDKVLFWELSAAASGGEESMTEEAAEAVAAAGFPGADGEEKKEVMEAFALGFFAVEAAISAAFRLRGVAIL